MWLQAVKTDVRQALDQKDKGIHSVMKSLKSPFGEKSVSLAFANYGEKQLQLRNAGGLKMAGITGMIGSVGRTSITQHTNFGAKKDQ